MVDEKVQDSDSQQTIESKKLGNPALLFLLVITWAVIGVGSYFSYVEFWQKSQNKISQLEERLTRLSLELTEEKSKVQNIIDNERNAGLDGSLEDENKQQVLKESEVEQLLTERTSLIEKRLYDLSEEIKNKGSASNKLTGVIIAAVNLRDAIGSGKPYKDELNILKNAGEENLELQKHLESLQLKADSGISPYSSLKESFASVAWDVVNQSRETKVDPDFTDKVASYLSNVISVRKIGEVEGDSVEAKIARAENLINNENLEQAIIELETIDNGESLQDWLQKAKIYNETTETSKNILNQLSENAALEILNDSLRTSESN